MSVIHHRLGYFIDCLQNKTHLCAVAIATLTGPVVGTRVMGSDARADTRKLGKSPVSTTHAYFFTCFGYKSVLYIIG